MERIQPDYISTFRTSIGFHKFELSAESEGFVNGSYIMGLTQTECYYDAISGRYQIYQKGNSVKDDGYTARRVSKGLDNLRCGQNGIILGDGGTIIT